ncbi:MAG: tRNA (adenosine(37)-N6)-threonylcarbamoyltransferase complex ATPase subunit type 1 TsaE [Desulfobacterales bacterium]|nr:tRNA (adenosine(37)-N6)-threonylcarbamoyltransferase complex ATPase subunit type 1 TsaE [Desulfobacterales bacterium]MBF0397234.1 tRNA (adenosine(37)-N6)-threonylcarbamoyltransferase complex ATPase subunit type 1 TsaE [Desulfobacterales bacterium]
MEFITNSTGETQDLAYKLGLELKKRSIVALNGDLGSGKTCFIQGIARGLNVPPQYPIVSPTFTFINEYPGRIPLFHVDLYRICEINDLEENLEEIGFFELFSKEGVVAIEWADRLPDGFIEDALFISIEILDDYRRKIIMKQEKK